MGSRVSCLVWAPVSRRAASRCAPSRFRMRSVAWSRAARVRLPLPSPASKGSPNTTSILPRSRGSALVRPSPRGSAVPSTATGTIGAPERTAKYASPERSEAKSPSPRVPSGKMPSTPPRSSTPRAWPIAVRSALVRSTFSCPIPRRNGSSGPVNASFLTRKCTGRGEVPITIGPSTLWEWFPARMTGPADGTRQAPSTRGRHSPYIRPMPIRRAAAAPAALGSAASVALTPRSASPRRG